MVEIRRPEHCGKPMITVEELAAITGLAPVYLRERTRPYSRGALIAGAHKIGKRLWFEKDKALESIESQKMHQSTPKPKQLTIDMDWL